MKIYVYPADAYGCGFYRMIWPAQALLAQGHDVQVVMPKQRGFSLRAEVHDDTVVDAFYPEDADVIVLQRITHEQLVDAITIMRRKGAAVVIDIDDDLAAIDPSNPAWRAMHPKHGYSSKHSWLNTQRACDAATMVTVSTNSLLPLYARHSRGMVLQNCIPERYLDVKHQDSDMLGWGGALHVHPNDVQVMGPSIARLMVGNSKFQVVGPGTGVAKALGCSEDSVIATGNRDLHVEWPEALSTLGIGVAPLADTRFNKSKSWLKVLEYSSLGVPWVASPRDEYRRAYANSGAGLLANKPKQWLTKLRELQQNEAQRRELSAAGRAWGAQQTIEGNAWRWLEAWAAAYELV
jgi:hypothetical protein